MFLSSKCTITCRDALRTYDPSVFVPSEILFTKPTRFRHVQLGLSPAPHFSWPQYLIRLPLRPIRSSAFTHAHASSSYGPARFTALVFRSDTASISACAVLCGNANVSNLK
eukprot:IDg18740t1